VRILRGDLRGIEREHIESINALCESEQGHDRVIVPGIDALRSFDRLLLSPAGLRASQERDYQITLTLDQDLELPFQSGLLRVSRLKSAEPGNFCANFKKDEEEIVEVCDWDGDLLFPSGTLSSLCVRNWRPGDSFLRVGRHSVEKIKTLFQSDKVLLWERKHWPVVLAGGEIVWARQFGGAAKVSASGRSREIVRLIYRPAIQP
jgi:tRNA(Ile)-lysidine synthase